MYINSVKLNNFRNYRYQEIEFCKGINLIIGDNGHGKTNIIEAIYISSYAKSFRTPRDMEMINFDFDRFNTYVEFVCDEKNNRNESVEICINRKKEKRIKYNDIPITRLQDIIGEIIVVLFSPEDMKLVKDAPAERRRFLDREISALSKGYFAKLIEYNKILNHRNNLLKLIAMGKADNSQLEVWNEKLADTCIYIMKKRNDFINDLKNYACDINSEMTSNRDKLDIFYDSSMEFSNNSEEQKKIIIKSLENSIERDLYRGHTGKGCHKDDIIFMVNEKDLRSYGSQGQKRTCVLSVKLAQTKIIKDKKGFYPVLLLDDVLSELDIKRQNDIIKYASNIQTIITSAEINSEILNNLKNSSKFSFKKFIVVDGEISESQV